MPQPDHRPAARIAPDIAQVRVWQLVEAKATLAIECDNCHHAARWPPALIAKKFARHKANTLTNAAPRVRCGNCRSGYVRIWQVAGGRAGDGARGWS